MTEEIFDIEITEEFHKNRIDKALSALVPTLSRSRIQALIEGGHVALNNSVCANASLKVKTGDQARISVPEAEDPDPQPENIPLNIIYEDHDLLVIDKPAGLVVHPGAGNHSGTLVNALLYHCGDTLSGIGGVKRPGIVHRLDKDTSGLMVVAKNDKTHQALSDQLKSRSLSRVYHTFVWRCPFPPKGFVDKPIGRHKTHRLKMAIGGAEAREAKTHYHVLETYKDSIALVECKLESGRTHQIRVHMQSLKHPLIGDPLYGLNRQESESILKKAGFEPYDDILDFGRQALHAREIVFFHPGKEEDLHFLSDLPEDLESLKSQLKQ